jgi:hypothetical protein
MPGTDGERMDAYGSPPDDGAEEALPDLRMVVTARKGRPPLINDALIDKIAEGLKLGLFLGQAAIRAGIAERTVHLWLKKGKDDEEAANYDSPYFALVQAVRLADVSAEARVVMAWQTKIPGDWRAAQAFLQRRWRDRWAPPTEMAIPPEFMMWVSKVYTDAFNLANRLPTAEERAEVYLAESDRALASGYTEEHSEPMEGGSDPLLDRLDDEISAD